MHRQTMLGRQLPRWFSKQTIVVYVLNATRKTIAGNFWRLTIINQWVLVKFKILSCLFDFIWPDFTKFDRTFLTVVKFVTVSFKCSIIFNSVMFLLCDFKILSCYYFCKIKLLTQSARMFDQIPILREKGVQAAILGVKA